MDRFSRLVTYLLIASVGVFPIGCSTRYISHTDEPRPYQSDHLDTQVRLSKQGASAADETTIGYCLFRSTPVVNHYHGTDTFKRSSWVGIGVLVGSAYIGWMGIDRWANTPQTNIYGDPNPNYAREQTLGKTLTLASIAGVIAGAIIHFSANRELMQSTMKVDTALIYEPIQNAPMKICEKDTLVQSQRTDEKGNFKVDLSPFIQHPSPAKNTDLRIFPAEYPSVVERLSVPVSFITRVQQERLWMASGFSVDEMTEWKIDGFPSPQSARPWQDAGLTPAEARTWSAKGFSPAQAREQADVQQKAEEAKIAKELAKQREIDNLEARAEKLPAIMLANPYDTKGKIYEVVGMQFQLFSKSVALYRTDDQFVFLADFNSSSAPRVFKGIARAVDPYSYLGTDGTVHIVPQLKVLHITERIPED